MRLHSHKPVSAAERAQLDRAEDEARQRSLYGKHLDAVKILRARDYVVTRKGNGVQVGNKTMTFAEMETMAKREGGLAGMAFTRKTETASGLKVGQTVALAPKKKPTAAVVATNAPRKLAGAAADAKAKAAVHSTELGTKPRVVWLDLALLDVDRRYQREINGHGEAHINRILRGFNWNCYQPIIVTETEGGRFAVIDGQHRLEAAKKHPLIDSLPCYIIDAPDVAVQAQIFVSVNSDRRALTSLQKFWATWAGGNIDAKALVDACEAAGVTIPRVPPTGGLQARMLLGPTVALRLVARWGRPAVIAAIGMLAEAWPEARTAFRIANLTALATIASTPYSRNRLVTAMKATDPERVYADAIKDLPNMSGTALATATQRVLSELARGA